MYPLRKTPYEDGHRKVPEMGTPPYTRPQKTPETSGFSLTDAAGNPEPALPTTHAESE